MRKVSLLIILFFLASCRSKDGDINVFSVEDDIKLGEQYKGLLATPGNEQNVLSRKEYAEAYKYLDGIVDEILRSPSILHRTEFPWEVYIIKNDSVLNAFCTPGGYIYVYTGLIRFLESEDQLAGVLGHEIAHADLRHSTEQMTKSYGLRILIHIIAGDGSVLGDAAGSLLSLNFSRGDETEADMKSVEYLMDTQYDPRGVARFFEKMQARGETLGPLKFLSTHPNPENRVEDIYQEWKERGSRTGKTNKERYQEFKNVLPE